MKAAELKNQAAHAKRTSTALEQLSKQLALSDADKKVLQRAAVILASVGSKVKGEAATAKRKEVALEKAVAAATVEVKKLIAAWPSETALDKVAIICANRFGEDNLRRYIEEKSGRELDWYVGSMFENALKDIVSDAAYRSVVDGKPVVAVMEYARQQLEKYRTQASVQGFAKQWHEKVQAEA